MPKFKELDQEKDQETIKQGGLGVFLLLTGAEALAEDPRTRPRSVRSSLKCDSTSKTTTRSSASSCLWSRRSRLLPAGPRPLRSKLRVLQPLALGRPRRDQG